MKNNSTLSNMGRIKHNAIICVSWDSEELEESHRKAKEIFKKYNFEQLVSEIVPHVTNGGASFFISPDGSMEGWIGSQNGDEARKEFLDFLRDSKDNFTDYVEVRFGGDNDYTSVTRSSDKGLW